MKEQRNLAEGKRMRADDIVTFIKETNKDIQDYFCDVNFDEVDFHGCSVPYVQEKIELVIMYLKFISKNLDKVK